MNDTEIRKQQFIQKAIQKHGDKYDYSLTEYFNTRTKIKIICNEHGIFEQTPNNHLAGQNCIKCAGLEKYTKNTFTEKANIVHDNKYDYEEVEYINNRTKVKISCKMHGPFQQLPEKHLNEGNGCPVCSGKKKKTTKEFIIQSMNIHGDLYDYSKSIYVNSHAKLIIICKNCNKEFQTKPYSHTSLKTGCPKCSGGSISKIEIDWLNDLNIEEKYRQYFLKINNKPYKVDGFNPETKTIYEFLGDFWHGNPMIFKSENINGLNKKTFGDLHKETFERIKLFEDNGYKIVYVWESDFRKSQNKKVGN